MIEGDYIALNELSQSIHLARILWLEFKALFITSLKLLTLSLYFLTLKKNVCVLQFQVFKHQIMQIVTAIPKTAKQERGILITKI